MFIKFLKRNTIIFAISIIYTLIEINISFRTTGKHKILSTIEIVSLPFVFFNCGKIGSLVTNILILMVLENIALWLKISVIQSNTIHKS